MKVFAEFSASRQAKTVFFGQKPGFSWRRIIRCFPSAIHRLPSVIHSQERLIRSQAGAIHSPAGVIRSLAGLIAAQAARTASAGFFLSFRRRNTQILADLHGQNVNNFSVAGNRRTPVQLRVMPP
jgi:hypothetical protein